MTIPESLVSPLAVFPGRSYDYLAELERIGDEPLLDDAGVLSEVDGFFRGALRPESPFCLYNSDFRPTIEATAAACLTIMNNVNGLMDAFGGESLLVEQKVARTIGHWVGWPSAMGISCNGGKLTMLYALRCALTRLVPDSLRAGLSRRTVILCSSGAHYSVEHVAALVGIGSENVIRVPLDSGGAMQIDALSELLDAAHEDGAAVAAVVCSGGTTIDFCCDDTSAVFDTVAKFTSRHALRHRPYLHFDSVIGWAYLSFSDFSTAELESTIAETPARQRIAEVLRRMRSLSKFDSMGADFHKTGLCPYPSSFFVARDRRFMDDLGTGDYAYGSEDFHSGNFRAYRFTVENSRPMSGVLAAWVNLCRLGRRGIGDYVLSLYRARAGVEEALANRPEIRQLNTTSLGWEVVVELPIVVGSTPGETAETAVAFIEHCWHLVRAGADLPLISIVPEFHPEHDSSRTQIGFLLYPMHEASIAARHAAVEAILREVVRFAAHRGPDKRPLTRWEKPIR